MAVLEATSNVKLPPEQLIQTGASLGFPWLSNNCGHCAMEATDSAMQAGNSNDLRMVMGDLIVHLYAGTTGLDTKAGKRSDEEAERAVQQH